MAKNINSNAKETSTNAFIRTNSDQTLASTSTNNIKQNAKRTIGKRIILNPSSDAIYTDQSNSKCQQNRRSTINRSSINDNRIISYSEEIRRMMHSFGDVRQPLIESARMIESIVRHQMTILLFEAQNVAKMRYSQSSTNSSRTHISVEDFIYLLRHDRHRLAKLIRYLKFKDNKLKVLSSSLVESSEKQQSTPRQSKISKSQLECLYIDVKNEIETDNSNDWSGISNGHGNVCADGESSSSFETSNTVQNQTNLKRVNKCQDIVCSVIQTPQNRCEIEKLIYNYPNVTIDTIDDYTYRRNRRLSEFTERMSVKEYLYYQSCRSVTFFGTSSISQTISPTMFQKFQEWILSSFDELDRLELRPNTLGWEVVQYFAHETVAILVELALLVRQDQNRCVFRPGINDGSIRCNYSTTFDTMSAKRFRKESSLIMKKHTTKMSKCDPMMNQINNEQNNHLNGVGGKKSNLNEQFIVDILSRTSEKVKAFQTVTSSTTTTTTNNNNSNITNNNNSLKKLNNIHNAITTEQLLEAMRRFEFGTTNVFKRFQRCHGWLYGQNIRNRILCLHC